MLVLRGNYLNFISPYDANILHQSHNRRLGFCTALQMAAEKPATKRGGDAFIYGIESLVDRNQLFIKKR
jgi:hypothetical protein